MEFHHKKLARYHIASQDVRSISARLQAVLKGKRDFYLFRCGCLCTVEKCYENADIYGEKFGISHLFEKHPYELSGGEKQRVSICRALINNPDLILADEPTGNLDSKSGKMVINALNEINETLGKAIIMVTHDPQMASYCSRIFLLKDGMILEDLRREGTKDEFYTQILGEMKEL